MGQSETKEELPKPNEIDTPEEALLLYYNTKVVPVEKRHLFADFYTPPIEKADMDAKASILLLGEYSVGKTTMLQYLLNEEIPGSHIGIEPTTEHFVFLMKSHEFSCTPGQTLLMDRKFPFQSIRMFGSDLINQMQGANVVTRMLDQHIIIDTPGIQSEFHRRVNRGYEYSRVIKYLVEKVDRVWLIFDTSKLDISDEFSRIIQNLDGQTDKVRFILNKADSVTAEELNRIRGVLMWNLGKIFNSVEVPDLLIGSFWDHSPRREDLKEIFLKDFQKLSKDVVELPTTVRIRKINDIVKRTKKVWIHACLMNELMTHSLKRSSTMNIRKWTQNERLLQRCYESVQMVHKIPQSDLPSPRDFLETARKTHFHEWKKFDRRLMDQLENGKRPLHAREPSGRLMIRKMKHLSSQAKSFGLVLAVGASNPGKRLHVLQEFINFDIPEILETQKAGESTEDNRSKGLKLTAEEGSHQAQTQAA